MAPQTDEFGAKVGLLAGLVVICAARPLLDRFVPEPASERPTALRRVRDRLRARRRLRSPRRRRAGRPRHRRRHRRRRERRHAAPALANADELLNRLPTNVDPATLPAITVGEDVVDFDHELAGAGHARGRRHAGPQPRAREPGAAARDEAHPRRRRPRGPARRDAGAGSRTASATGNDRHHPLPVRHDRRLAPRAVRRSRPASAWASPAAGR